MNARIEVDQHAGDGSAGTAEVREPDQKPDVDATTILAPIPAGNPVLPGLGAEDAHNGADRVSVDPLRGTDRYRLVAPLSLLF